MAAVIIILLTLTGALSTNIKNHDSLTESRMLAALVVIAVAVFEYYCIVELLLK